MGRFEQIRDRLPSLYRPGDDDPTGQPLPLRPEDILEINGIAPTPGTVASLNGAIIVALETSTRISRVRLSRESTHGALASLLFYRLDGESPQPLPSASAIVRNGVADLQVGFGEAGFALRLVRFGLLAVFLQSVADVLETIDRECIDVMQAHWFPYADKALYSAFLHRNRELTGAPAPLPKDLDVKDFPYISDLARAGSLLALQPWRDPPAQRENVEDYRERISKIVRLYRNGLGTVRAMRSMLHAVLPPDMPFTVEEFAPLLLSTHSAQGRGQPLDMVGPLMRWPINNDGLSPAAPTVYVQGVLPEAGKVDATERPVIEFYESDAGTLRLGLAYDGSLEPDQVLRVRPAYGFWFAADDGLQHAVHLPDDDANADPTALGSWEPVAGLPDGEVTAIHQTRDGVLWTAVNSPETGTIMSFDGVAWKQALSGLPQVHCMAHHGDDLLLGTDTGLWYVSLYGGGDDPPDLTALPGGLEGMKVHALLRASDGTWWAGTETGVARGTAGGPNGDWQSGAGMQTFVLGDSDDTKAEVYAIHEDEMGMLYFGTSLGLFQYQPRRDRWYWYEGKEYSEQFPDWQPFYPDGDGPERNFPTESKVFLPPVRCMYRGPDASLWIGTDYGIARYIAHSVDGLTYTTMLEALPDLANGRVHTIQEDERGCMWFATEQGLFRYDGVHWWQVQKYRLTRLERDDVPAGDPTMRKSWRFRRDRGCWESRVGETEPVEYSGTTIGSSEKAVRALAWTDEAVADLGHWDGSQFICDPAATPGPIRMRYKPTDRRIVDGGLPAIPRLPVGESTWRYLSIEPPNPPTPRSFPAWTAEGRLLPPPDNRPADLEGRYGTDDSADLSGAQEFSHFDTDAVFTFNPAARVWFTWGARRPLTVLARLRTTPGMEQVDPAILDRAWQGIEQVRPAGIYAMLAVDERIVRRR